MARAMGHPWFGSKATSGLCQALIALMPPHAVYIETHLRIVTEYQVFPSWNALMVLLATGGPAAQPP